MITSKLTHLHPLTRYAAFGTVLCLIGYLIAVVTKSQLLVLFLLGAAGLAAWSGCMLGGKKRYVIPGVIVIYFGLIFLTPEPLSPSLPVAPVTAKINPDRARIFTAKDFLYGKDDVPEKYKDLVVIAINRIHQQDSRCVHIDPADVSINPYAKPGKPEFQVLCGKLPNTTLITFTPHDIESGRVFKAPTYYQDIAQADSFCQQYAKLNASFPDTIKFDWFRNHDQQPDGLTVVTQKFTAKNAYGVPDRLAAECTFNDRTMTAAKIFRIVE